MVKEPNNSPKPRKPKRWLIFIASTVVALVAVYYIGSSIQNNITDGTENYTGYKLKLAENALKRLRAESDISPVAIYHHLRVDDIRPSTAEEVQEECHPENHYSSDPNNPGHYTVVVSDRSLFGIKTFSINLPACTASW